MGFMGVGKTKVGAILAKHLNYGFVDTDDVIIRNAGMPISEIFEKFGEPHFRQLETEAIRQVSSVSRQIIALGGGAVMKAENREMITQSGVTVALSYPPEIIFNRVTRNNKRPLLHAGSREEQMQKIVAMMKQRSSTYQKADVVLHFNCEVPAENVALAIQSYLGVFD